MLVIHFASLSFASPTFGSFNSDMGRTIIYRKIGKILKIPIVIV